MDTNMSQAIKIAGGLLIALLLISALVYFFKALSPIQTELEDIKALEQTADFNKEFEVYDKDIMYGLDIISVINKAASHNEVYINEYGYSEELKDNYLVDIQITLKNDLEERLQIYYANSVLGEKKEVEYLLGSFEEGPFTKFVDTNSIRNINFEEIFSKLDINEEIEKDTLLSRNPYTILESGIYELIENDKDTKYCNSDLYKVIIEDSVKPQIIIKNTTNNLNDLLLGEWTKVVFTTGVYDFKTKKFRCVRDDEAMENRYSDITQRIIRLEFEEI